MPPKPLCDLAAIDFDHPLIDSASLDLFLPQRFEFRQLDAVVHHDPETHLIVGYKDIRPDEFWVRGHIPGQPIFPGVLQLEVAAQLCTVYQMRHFQDGSFFGFGGLDAVKFRGKVVPGDRLVVICQGKSLSPRRSVFACQGFVRDVLVFEAEITGIRMEKR